MTRGRTDTWFSWVRRLSVLAVVAVIVWGLVLFTRVLSSAARDGADPGLIVSTVVLPLLVAVCARVARDLWRRHAERP